MAGRCTHKLDQEDLEESIINLIKNVIDKGEPIQNEFTNLQIIEILHYAADLFMSQPILLEFDIPTNGIVVVGDLHGSASSLVRTFEICGLPPKMHYLFLGDYIDRGPEQLELVLLLLMLKLRWPENIILLRGNHETAGFIRDDYLHLITVQNDLFVKMCRKQLRSSFEMYLLFHQMFDVMPIAAIISGRYLCCHGGVSQWMTCRENIRNIPRPTFARRMTAMEGCMLADILWAEPNHALKNPFEASKNGVAYDFNKEGLQVVLESLNLKTLVRGTEVQEPGLTRDFNDDSCFSIHSVPTARDTSNAVIKLMYIDGIHLFDLIPEELNTSSSLTNTCCAVTERLSEGFKETTFRELSRARPCKWCINRPTHYFHGRSRFNSHEYIDNWIHQYAYKWAQLDRTFARCENLLEIDPLDYNAERKRIQRSVELFPSYCDLRFLEGGNVSRGGTFRVLVTNDERKFMRMVYSHSPYLFNRTPFLMCELRAPVGDAIVTNQMLREAEPVLSFLRMIQGFCRRIYTWIVTCTRRYIGRRGNEATEM